MRISTAADSYEPSSKIKVLAYDRLGKCFLNSSWVRDLPYKKQFDITYRHHLRRQDEFDIELRFCWHGVMRLDQPDHDFFRTFLTPGRPRVWIDLNFPGALRNPSLWEVKDNALKGQVRLQTLQERDNSYTYVAETSSKKCDGFIFMYDSMFEPDPGPRINFPIRPIGKTFRLKSGEELCVRPSLVEEISHVYRLEYGIEHSNAASEEVLRKRRELFPDGFLVGLINDHVVGYIETIIWHRWEFEMFSQIADFELHHDIHGTHLYVIFMAVGQEHRGKGIGSFLLEEAIEIGKYYGATQVHLVSKEGLEELYRKKGFEDVRRLENFLPEGGGGTLMKKAI